MVEATFVRSEEVDNFGLNCSGIKIKGFNDCFMLKEAIKWRLLCSHQLTQVQKQNNTKQNPRLSSSSSHNINYRIMSHISTFILSTTIPREIPINSPLSVIAPSVVLLSGLVRNNLLLSQGNWFRTQVVGNCIVSVERKMEIQLQLDGLVDSPEA